MMRLAYASPIPGSVFSWSAVAVLISSRSGAGAGARACGDIRVTAGAPAASTSGRPIRSPRQQYESRRLNRVIHPPEINSWDQLRPSAYTVRAFVTYGGDDVKILAGCCLIAALGTGLSSCAQNLPTMITAAP